MHWTWKAPSGRRGKTLLPLNYALFYEEVWRNAATAQHILNLWSPLSRSRNFRRENHINPINGGILGLTAGLDTLVNRNIYPLSGPKLSVPAWTRHYTDGTTTSCYCVRTDFVWVGLKSNFILFWLSSDIWNFINCDYFFWQTDWIVIVSQLIIFLREEVIETQNNNKHK
jgi:hypothetical protein